MSLTKVLCREILEFQKVVAAITKVGTGDDVGHICKLIDAAGMKAFGYDKQTLKDLKAAAQFDSMAALLKRRTYFYLQRVHEACEVLAAIQDKPENKELNVSIQKDSLTVLSELCETWAGSLRHRPAVVRDHIRRGSISAITPNIADASLFGALSLLERFAPAEKELGEKENAVLVESVANEIIHVFEHGGAFHDPATLWWAIRWLVTQERSRYPAAIEALLALMSDSRYQSGAQTDKTFIREVDATAELTLNDERSNLYRMKHAIRIHQDWPQNEDLEIRAAVLAFSGKLARPYVDGTIPPTSNMHIKASRVEALTAYWTSFWGPKTKTANLIREELVVKGKQEIKLSDVCAIGNAVRDCAGFRCDVNMLLGNLRRYVDSGRFKRPYCVLLCAAPGTGKSFLSEEFARVLQVEFDQINLAQMPSISDLSNSMSKSKIGTNAPKRDKPTLVLIDEVDAPSEGVDAYGRLLSPLWDLTVTDDEHGSVRLAPAIFFCAISEFPTAADFRAAVLRGQLPPKAKDFLSRIDDEIDLPGLAPGMDQVYVAAALMRRLLNVDKVQLGALQVFGTAEFPDNSRGIEKALKSVITSKGKKLQNRDIPSHVQKRLVGELPFDAKQWITVNP